MRDELTHLFDASAFAALNLPSDTESDVEIAIGDLPVRGTRFIRGLRKLLGIDIECDLSRVSKPPLQVVDIDWLTRFAERLAPKLSVCGVRVADRR